MLKWRGFEVFDSVDNSSGAVTLILSSNLALGQLIFKGRILSEAMTSKVPMLSPVLEDFVPPRFRGNVPDDVVDSPTPPPTTTSPPQEFTRNRQAEMDSRAEETSSTRSCSRVVVMLLQWRKRSQPGAPVHVMQKKPVQIQALQRQKSKENIKSKRSVTKTGLHYINPLCLLSKLRDTYIHMMNNVATSKIVASSGPVYDSTTAQSTLFFSREYDAESIAELVALERSGSKPNAEYLQNMEAHRKSSRVKSCGDVIVLSQLSTTDQDLINRLGAKRDTEPALTRSQSNNYLHDASVSSSKQGVKSATTNPSLSRSKSKNAADGDIFFKKNNSRRKKLHINPYADSDWKAEIAIVSETKAGKTSTTNDFQFQPMAPKTQHWLQQTAADENSLFTFQTSRV